MRPAGSLARDEADSLDLSGYVLLPAPAEPHAHLDKALTAERVEVQAGDLNAAIEAWHAHRAGLGAEDIARRAESAALIALARGTTAVRTHVDVGEGIELRAAEALVSVRDRLRPLMDIQVVALSYPLAGAAGAENRALVRAALELGVDVVGGAPHIDPDPGRPHRGLSRAGRRVRAAGRPAHGRAPALLGRPGGHGPPDRPTASRSP